MFRKTWTLAATAAVLLLVGGVAAASIPDASGVIHGCRKNSDGSVKVIDSDLGQVCGNGYTALNWSQTGPQGPAGPTGPQGPAGPSGMQRSIPGGGFVLAPGEERRATVLCPTGQAVLSGGWTQGGDNIHVYGSYPQTSPAEGWIFDTINTGVTATIGFYAICTVVA